MNYRRVGRSGLMVSEISLGAWLTYGGSVEQQITNDIVAAAVDGGVNFIDIADIYSKGKAETLVGNAIRGMTRSNLVISSKLFWPMSEDVNDRGLSRKHIMESVEKSLLRIGTDYLDIYFCHRFDPNTEVEETVRAMDDLVHQGKVLYWGTSVWEAAHIERAVGDARATGSYLPIVEQPRYNVIDRHIEPDILPTCDRYGMGLVVWSPLAQGLLTGKYRNGSPEGSRGATTEWLKGDLNPANIEKVNRLEDLARGLDLTLSQLALAWTLRLPTVSSAITGATRVEHIQSNITASGVVLNQETLEAIDAIVGV